MLSSIKKLIRPERSKKSLPAVPEGERYYVIGDIHGCLDHFAALADAIDADAAENTEWDTTVVLLGDLVDRGPDSAGVIAKAREWGQQRKLRFLAGNHEEMFLESFSDLEMLRHFVKHGGRETIMSYGIAKKEYRELTLEELLDKIDKLVPQADRDFLSNFEEMIIAGDYVFAHAGIDPSRPLDDQRRKDLLWIRERFLRSIEPLSHVIVHGHTIFETVEDCGTRIGIDTGAFRTGILTALVLEGSERRTIQAVEKDGQIEIKKTEGKS